MAEDIFELYIKNMMLKVQRLRECANVSRVI
jgi:hypothetical protein